MAAPRASSTASRCTATRCMVPPAPVPRTKVDAHMTSMTGGQALARQLVNEGVEVIFGLPGDQTMHALDGLYEERDHIRFITTRHEQGTTYMADGYARA